MGGRETGAWRICSPAIAPLRPGSARCRRAALGRASRADRVRTRPVGARNLRGAARRLSPRGLDRVVGRGDDDPAWSAKALRRSRSQSGQDAVRTRIQTARTEPSRSPSKISSADRPGTDAIRPGRHAPVPLDGQRAEPGRQRAIAGERCAKPPVSRPPMAFADPSAKNGPAPGLPICR